MVDTHSTFETAWRSRRRMFPVLALPLIGYVIWITGSFFVRPNPIWALLLFLWAIAAAMIGWLLTRETWVWILDTLDRYSTAIVVSLMLVSAAFFIGISLHQSLTFVPQGTAAEDNAYYSQVLWNTLHGNFLSGNVQQERLYSPPVTNDLAIHVSPALFVGLLPVYAVFPHALTLLVVRDLVLVAAAWPLFLLARERMGGAAGIAAVALYLTNPAVITQGAESFTLLQLAPLPFFYALRSFVREEFGSFACWAVIALMMREEVAIIVTGFGLWALVRRRPLRWWIAPLVIPSLWWGFATLLVQPAFGRQANFAIDVALAGGNQSQFGAYRVLLGNPTWILHQFSQGGLAYVYYLLRLTGFLPVLSPEGVLAAPGLLANLFLARGYFRAFDPVSRFALLPSCALIGATIVVVSTISGKYRLDRRALAVIMLILLPSTSLLDGVKEVVREQRKPYSIPNDAPALRTAIGHIPSAVTVAAPDYALPALSKRPKLYNVEYLQAYPIAQPEYVLLDRKLDRVTSNFNQRMRYVTVLETLSRSADYETVWQHGDYLLVHRLR